MPMYASTWRQLLLAFLNSHGPAHYYDPLLVAFLPLRSNLRADQLRRTPDKSCPSNVPAQ